MEKSIFVVVSEAICYLILSMGPTWVILLESDRDLTDRLLIATTIASIVQGATAIKAYISQRTVSKPIESESESNTI